MNLNTFIRMSWIISHSYAPQLHVKLRHKNMFTYIRIYLEQNSNPWYSAWESQDHMHHCDQLTYLSQSVNVSLSTSMCLSHCRSYVFHSIGALGWKEIGRYFPIPDFYISTLRTLKFYCQLNEETSRHICSWEWSSTRLKLKCFRDHKARNTRKWTFHTLSFSRSEFSKFI